VDRVLDVTLALDCEIVVMMRPSPSDACEAVALRSDVIARMERNRCSISLG
jgi:hypothetical protein